MYDVSYSVNLNILVRFSMSWVKHQSQGHKQGQIFALVSAAGGEISCITFFKVYNISRAKNENVCLSLCRLSEQ